MKSFWKVLIIFVSVCLLAEIYYRLTGQFKVYFEKVGKSYVSGYGVKSNTWYLTLRPNDTLRSYNSDIHYPYYSNAWGLREKQIPQKSDSVIRILVTGDSFAEGFGAPYDSTWPRLLETYLRLKNQPVEVIDAGLSGSDIFFDYVRYRDIFYKLKPDIIIASMNSSDFPDYAFRGGMERFRADSTTQGRPAPWIETPFRYSHFFRAIGTRLNNYPFDGLFLNRRAYMDSCKATLAPFQQVYRKFNEAAISNHAQFITVFHVTPSEIESPDYDVNKTALAQLHDIGTVLQKDGIPNIPIIEGLAKKLSKEPWQKYTYPNDKHFTGYGYAVMAQMLADSIVADKILR
jgi:lysophospholipase L1-like esterase